MKQLKDLTLLDKFLFDETMDHPEAHEALLQIILGQEELKLMTPSQTEKEFRTMPWLRSIRVDVYALDQKGTVYDTEMQAEHRTDLAKRSRYYQGLIDSSLLEPGSISFNKLNNTYIIIITPYDLFEKEKYCYTFVPCCREDKNVELQDGAIRIFLNTKGKNDDEVSQELRDFLHYVETTDEKIAENSESERLKKIHACVSRVKSSEEAGVKYMQKWEEKINDREEGERKATLSSMQKLMEKMNMTAEEALDFLEVPKDEWEKYLK